MCVRDRGPPHRCLHKTPANRVGMRLGVGSRPAKPANRAMVRQARKTRLPKTVEKPRLDCQYAYARPGGGDGRVSRDRQITHVGATGARGETGCLAESVCYFDTLYVCVYIQGLARPFVLLVLLLARIPIIPPSRQPHYARGGKAAAVISPLAGNVAPPLSCRGDPCTIRLDELGWMRAAGELQSLPRIHAVDPILRYRLSGSRPGKQRSWPCRLRPPLHRRQ